MNEAQTVERPWARKRQGGWVIWRPSLIDPLKSADVVDIDGVRLDAQHLKQMLDNTPGEDFLLKTEGERFDCWGMHRTWRVHPGDKRLCHFKKGSYFCLYNGRNVPLMPRQVVVIKPKFY